MNREQIILKNITYAYPGQSPVFCGLNLVVYKGEYLVLTGPNGSAKTTLLKIILGLLQPREGYVEIKAGPEKNRSVFGYVPQRSASHNPGFPATVAEAVGSPIKLPFARKQLVQQILAKVDLLEKKNTLLGCLSGGQLQRVFITRALVNNPQILVLDEPFVNLDRQSQNDFLDLLVRLNKEGMTLLLVTHDLTPIAGHASRIFRMTRGKLRETGLGESSGKDCLDGITAI